MLATCRFEVLQQVQCVPEVLGSVVAEVERRRLYRTLFLEVCFLKQVIIPQLINMYCSAQHAKTVSRQFKTARDEERNQRRAFREKYDHHFILTLFPSLSDRPPEFAVSVINVLVNVLPFTIFVYNCRFLFLRSLMNIWHCWLRMTLQH